MKRTEAELIAKLADADHGDLAEKLIKTARRGMPMKECEEMAWVLMDHLEEQNGAAFTKLRQQCEGDDTLCRELGAHIAFTAEGRQDFLPSRVTSKFRRLSFKGWKGH